MALKGNVGREPIEEALNLRKKMFRGYHLKSPKVIQYIF